MEPFPEIPEDLSALSDEDLKKLIADGRAALDAVKANPQEFLSDERTGNELVAQMSETVEAIEAASAELSRRVPEDFEAKVAELAARAADAADDEDADPDADPDDADDADDADDDPDADADADKAAVKGDAPAAEPVTASSQPGRRLPRSRQAEPVSIQEKPLSFTAAAHGDGIEIGQEVSFEDIGRMMIRKRAQWPQALRDQGDGEKFSIAKVDWSDRYPAERRLAEDEGRNMELVAAALDPEAMKVELDRRAANSLTAAGGLCAPLTPYYARSSIATADRPVRAALPSFNADRGGIRYNRATSIGNVSTAIDTHTVAEDAIGGTTAAKTCQVIPCPPVVDVTIQIVSHCLQFGNLGARTFPELLAQWQDDTLAAQARMAETLLLDAIDAASTAVTAKSLKLNAYGATGDLLGQVKAAVAALRSRHRMAPNAVFRGLFPAWLLDLLVSDIYRSQFGRFDMTPERFIALLRAANVEPTFYLDGATGANQVFGVQAAGQLNTFPPDARWYLFPEGSFLFLDGGSLELGLVRDSVLNQTNDFQIFGETFEAAAFIGVESYRVVSSLCDNGVASAAVAVNCPDY